VTHLQSKQVKAGEEYGEYTIKNEISARQQWVCSLLFSYHFRDFVDEFIVHDSYCYALMAVGCCQGSSGCGWTIPV